MIPTARRCLGRLALLAAATATPVDYAADHVVFAHILVSRDVEGDGERAAAVRRDVGGHWTPLGAVGVIIERDDHGQQAAYRREGPQFHNQFQGHFFFIAFRRVSEARSASSTLKITKLSAPRRLVRTGRAQSETKKPAASGV